MTFVTCIGNEERMVDCSYSPNFYFFCGHYYDAGVRCQYGTGINSIVEHSKLSKTQLV